MRSSPSPPQEAKCIRHAQSTPESPRPQQLPSPANIPILVLEQQHMEQGFADPTPAHDSTHPQYPAQSQTPGALSMSHVPSQSFPGFPNAAVGAEHGASAGFAQSDAFGGVNAQAPDTSIHNYSTHQSRTVSSSDAPHAAPPANYATEAYAAPSVDIQALLDSLAPANSASQPPLASPLSAQPQANALSLPVGVSLPPRPPAQEKPATHPNYNPDDDIRSYHPHSQKPQNAQQRGNGHAGNARDGPQSPTTANARDQRSETPDSEDARWPPEINTKYEEFLDQERKFVTEGQWDQFPNGSRLFIGNLPTEKVTKRDIFHRFFRHGQLAQISIKQAYGFVQFLDSESCHRALRAEQGQAVRGRKMHLEISKPQRNTRKADQNGARRRSRSPDYTRGGSGQAGRDARYGGNAASPRDRRFRERDDYRPIRSPSPRGGRGMRRDRSRDRYDGRYRSRSRTPPRRRRSPSPDDYTEDGLDLRRRLPHEVPDIQILVLNEGLPRDFIRYVEDIFRSQNLSNNVLIMSGRFPEPAVVRRQILEGVLAIVRLDTAGLSKGRVGVQIFDHRGGAGNVQFNEYADLEPTTAGLLVLQAKQTQAQPLAQQPVAAAASYGYAAPQQHYQQPNPYTQQQQPQPAATQQNLSQLISSLDPSALSQLLGAMSGAGAANMAPQLTQAIQQQPATGGLDIARLLASVSTPTPAQGQSGAPQASAALAGMFGAAQQPQHQNASARTSAAATSGAAQPDMSEIMKQLASYQR